MNNHLLIPNFERGAFVVFAFQFNTSRKFKVFHFLFFAITFQKGTIDRKKERKKCVSCKRFFAHGSSPVNFYEPSAANYKNNIAILSPRFL